MKHSPLLYFLSVAVLNILLTSCTTSGHRTPAQADGKVTSSGYQYPQHWWKTPEDAAQKPKWEILPNEAKPGEVILSKRNELGILSNFAETKFTFRGQVFGSMEGFWQSLKFPENEADERNKNTQWKWTRDQVAAMVGFEAKAAGDYANKNMKKLGINWVSFQGKKMVYREKGSSAFYELIVEAMNAKMEQTEAVRAVLMSTGDLVLKPDHYDEENGPEAWKYYKIWMRLRSEEAERNKGS